jgi:hypothetical protein
MSVVEKKKKKKRGGGFRWQRLVDIVRLAEQPQVMKVDNLIQFAFPIVGG